jgi:hypothetical protein
LEDWSVRARCVNFGEQVQDLFGQAVGEVFIVGVAAHVGERQHGDGRSLIYGSVEAWQRATTMAWMVKIRGLLAAGRPVLFEGQMRIAFILGALAEAGITGAQVILADCSDNVRHAKLRTDRNRAPL